MAWTKIFTNPIAAGSSPVLYYQAYYSINRVNGDVKNQKIKVLFKFQTYFASKSSNHSLGTGSAYGINLYATITAKNTTGYKATTINNPIAIKRTDEAWSGTTWYPGHPKETTFSLTCKADSITKISFSCYTKRSSGNGTTGVFSTRTATLTAPAVYQITYKKDDSAPSSFSVPIDKNFYLKTSDPVTLKAPAQSADNFRGWNINGTVYNVNYNFQMSGNTTATAVFQVESKKQLFYSFIGDPPEVGIPSDANSILPATQTANTGNSIIIANQPISDDPNYIFQGWFDENGNKREAGESLTLNSDKTLVGKWILLQPEQTQKYIKIKDNTSTWKNAIVYINNSTWKKTIPFINTSTGWKSS